jgi:hypothetical protein
MPSTIVARPPARAMARMPLILPAFVWGDFAVSRIASTLRAPDGQRAGSGLLHVI